MLIKNSVFVRKITNIKALHCIGLSVCSHRCLVLSTMPAEQCTMRQCDKQSNDPKQEDCIQMAIEAVSTGHYRSYKAASIQMNVRT